MPQKLLTDAIANTEYWLAKYRYVSERFPDCNVNEKSAIFRSKLVNKNYTGLQWNTHRIHIDDLIVQPYYDLDFSYNGKNEVIKIYSRPKSNTLAKAMTIYPFGGGKERILQLSRFAKDLASRDFSEEMQNQCRTAILKFIADHPKHKLDTKNLAPRLKKLLMFT